MNAIFPPYALFRVMETPNVFPTTTLVKWPTLWKYVPARIEGRTRSRHNEIWAVTFFKYELPFDNLFMNAFSTA
jgi:hypothetical protein